VNKDFKIDIEHYGPKSVVFTRWEESDQEIISRFRGFGAEYKKAATRPVPGCERATGHYRVVSIVSFKQSSRSSESNKMMVDRISAA
jgi:hypothetical protein